MNKSLYLITDLYLNKYIVSGMPIFYIIMKLSTFSFFFIFFEPMKQIQYKFIYYNYNLLPNKIK